MIKIVSKPLSSAEVETLRLGVQTGKWPEDLVRKEAVLTPIREEWQRVKETATALSTRRLLALYGAWMQIGRGYRFSGHNDPFVNGVLGVLAEALRNIELQEKGSS